MEHLRSRSRNADSMKTFSFPRQPPPPPSMPAPAPAPPQTPRQYQHFDFGKLPTARQEPRQSWTGRLRKRTLLLCLVLGFTVLYMMRGGGTEAAAPPRPAAFVQQLTRTHLEPPRDAQKVQIGPPIDEPVEEKRTLQLSDRPAWVLSAPASRLPKCEKMLLYTFKPWWGFGSEYLLYLRAAALATKLGYTLVEDDSKWNYGRLTNYVLPRPISCVPPASWANPKKSYPLGHPGWEDHPRIRYSRSVLSSLDDWTRETYLGDGKSDEVLALRETLQARKGRDMLDEGESLPSAFEEVFTDVQREADAMWRLEPSLEQEVADVKAELGFSQTPWKIARELRPKGAGKGDRKAWSREKRALAESQGRGPIIGVHVRMGDKATEFAHDSAEMGISNTYGNMTVYVKAADDAYRRLLSSSSTPLSTGDAKTGFSPEAEPTLLVMTAEPDVLDSISAEPLAAPFRIISTPSPNGPSAGKAASAEEIERARKEFGNRKNLAYARKGDEGAQDEQRGRREKRKLGLSAGYDQATFNKLPLVERVVHTRAFVRDLTLLAREADAMVVSGSSNIGRLAMLLGGSDAAIGPRTSSGDSLGGRIRSVDAFWYPTAYLSAVWEKVADIPDQTMNKATVPKEQQGKGRGKGLKKGGAKRVEDWRPVGQM